MIGVIADDLTGAAEIGAVGLRFGLQAEIYPAWAGGNEAREAHKRSSNSQGELLLCLDTDTRSSPSVVAAQRAALAAAELKNSGCRWLYKKVDSVLRGNVTAELESIMQQLGLTQCLLIPANPSLERVIRDGQYFVQGLPINETEFARDPAYPRLSSSVLQLLAGSSAFPVSFLCVGKAIPDQGIAIGEAASVAHLQHWAARRSGQTMMAGGGEFFANLLASEGRVAVPPSAPTSFPHNERFLLVTGTTGESSRQFVETARATGIPVFSLPNVFGASSAVHPKILEQLALEAANSLARNPRLIVEVGLPFISERSIAAALHVHLAQLAELILRKVNVSHVYVEGGATAVELMQRMNWSRLAMSAELAQGVATVTVDATAKLQLTMKPGSYKWPEQIRATFLKNQAIN